VDQAVDVGMHHLAARSDAATELGSFSQEMMMTPDADTLDHDADELCRRIAILTQSIMDFWTGGGWAQGEASALLDRSMLHWKTSLAVSLSRWPHATSDGDLILAWTNLGTLVEGQLKLFLCVYCHDYASNLEGIRRRGERIDPDASQLEELRQFFLKHIWDAATSWNSYVELVQRRRNAVHAFQRRDIGTFDEWADALRLHLSFVRDIGGGLPYPDEGFSGLRET
jgi:hypothetical protein